MHACACISEKVCNNSIYSYRNWSFRRRRVSTSVKVNLQLLLSYPYWPDEDFNWSLLHCTEAFNLQFNKGDKSLEKNTVFVK